ncbi:MAG: ligase-associated DNA damage response endonuclease PdeM [Pseudomonadales bacterium]|jgi:DNA ligase-associated metallophosphoesterase|nr:ligase-associated DNA damage response endonuclease PdeM [Pseudomonadales bacterium]
MSSIVEVCLAGESVILDADRALIWQRRVLVADVHLDKASSFQRAGMAVPLGDEQRDLDRLAALAARHDAAEIIVLGDLVHAPPRPGSTTERVLLNWADAHRDLRLSVVLGNHDRDARERLAHWPLSWLDDDVTLGPFRLRHAPAPCPDPALFEIAGHLHPVVRLRDGNRDTARLSVFWQRPGGLVLPAFGSFTGGHPVAPAPGDRLHAVHGGSILSLPPRAA